MSPMTIAVTAAIPSSRRSRFFMMLSHLVLLQHDPPAVLHSDFLERITGRRILCIDTKDDVGRFLLQQVRKIRLFVSRRVALHLAAFRLRNVRIGDAPVVQHLQTAVIRDLADGP